MDNMSKPLFTIGVVADIIGVSVQTLRLWEAKGLINPSRKGKDRYYSEADVNRLKYIKHLLTDKKLNTFGVREILESDARWIDSQQTAPPKSKAKTTRPAPGQLRQQTAPTIFADRKRILIIDDDFDQIALLKTLLAPSHYETFIALNGRDGLEKAREINPDLIILDIMLPDIDGLDISREIKNSTHLAEIPILIFSIISEKMIDKLGLKGTLLTADDYAEKPMQPKHFIEKVERLIGAA